MRDVHTISLERDALCVTRSEEASALSFKLIEEDVVMDADEFMAVVMEDAVVEEPLEKKEEMLLAFTITATEGTMVEVEESM